MKQTSLTDGEAIQDGELFIFSIVLLIISLTGHTVGLSFAGSLTVLFIGICVFIYAITVAEFAQRNIHKCIKFIYKIIK